MFLNKKILYVCVFLTLCGCGTKSAKIEKHVLTHEVMGAYPGQIEVCGAEAIKDQVQPAISEVWASLDAIATRMISGEQNSEIQKINTSSPEPVSVSEDTYNLINRSIQFSHKTDGAFDITMAPMLQLWQQAALNQQVPSPESIVFLRQKIGYKKIELLDENQIRLVNSTVKIDLTQMALGYGIDQAVSILKKHGLENFSIRVADTMYLSGLNCEGNPWSVVIPDPRDKSEAAAVVALADRAISVFNAHDTFFQIGQESYSSVIQPTNGYPRNQSMGATLISPSALEASSLAKTLCVMDSDKATHLINSLGRGYASIIFEQTNGKMHAKASEELKKLQTIE